MQKYVLGFLFSPSGEEVVLIQKTKPDWQAGKLNGVGGKVEKDEDPYEAMCREFEEETGLDIHQWDHCTDMAEDGRWSCNVYRAQSSRYTDVRSMTEEQVVIKKVADLSTLNVVGNLRFLIPIALYPDSGFIQISY